MSDGKRTNRLIHETSPYLLQHADNPVDWYPWGEEAFDLAKRTGKPILLSIGYSACHWCHVMAHESFENGAIAKIMNEHFVNIKVDREERPDLDQIYQTAVQFFIQRGGGWPLTMFLTPEKVPFHGGTYFPPEDRHNLPGFPKILMSLSEIYRERAEDVASTTRSLLNAIGQLKKDFSKKSIDPALLEKSVENLVKIFDEAHGGFGGAPKFPSAPALSLLLRYSQQSGEQTFLEMVSHSLRKMAWGGMYDQIAGGFHRYSVDEAWQVPHFEKMLYDNAQLAPLYFSAYQATEDPFFKEIGIEILEYVLREMTDETGGFYASQDADSEGGEGSFYTWSPEEVIAVLGAESGEIINRYYQVTETGNFEGKSIPHPSDFIKGLADGMGKTEVEVSEVIRTAKERLRGERDLRPKPFTDEKMIVSWNSLMIGAFVQGYQVTRNQRYLTAATKATDFILKNLIQNRQLLHTFKDGVAKLRGYLDDVAYFADAQLDLYEATGETKYLESAKSLVEGLISGFWDDVDGGFYYTPSDHETLIDRTRPIHDQSVPSGNAVAAKALLRLFYFTDEPLYFEKGEKTLLAFATEMEKHPFSIGNMIAAADFYLRKPKEIHLVADLDSPDSEDLLAKIHQLYLPNKVLSFNHSEGFDHATWTDKKSVAGKPTVYICQNFTCSPPLTEWEAIRQKILG